jgi:PAS domain S-box-containing protein
MQEVSSSSAAPVQAAPFEQLYLQMPQACWVHDRQTLSVLDANPAAEQLYGYTRAELLALHVFDLCPPDEAARLRAPLAPDPAAGQHEALHRTRAGVDLAVRVKAVDIEWAGSPACIVFVTDFSGQRAASTELKPLYEGLDSADDMIIVTEAIADAQGNRPIVYVRCADLRQGGPPRGGLPAIMNPRCRWRERLRPALAAPVT